MSLIGLAAFLALSSVPSVLPSLPPDAPLPEPRWRVRPIPQYPPQAIRADIASGAVTLECASRQDRLVDCRVVEETPAGHGFADAALRSLEWARTSDTDGRVRFQVLFKLQ